MALVVFYEKPGCVTNARQKKLLAESGHTVEAKSLLTEPWTAERLAAFFGRNPVASWFNKAAPRVKSGEIDPEKTEALEALSLMLRDPLLIRRPLMEIEERKFLGFDAELLSAFIGLAPPPDKPLEGCSHAGTDKVCADPTTGEHKH
jgi:hypothetical protein